MNDRLASLLIDLSETSDEEANRLVFEKYVELYLDATTASCRVGVRETHDGEPVVFFEDRFDHAFFTSGQKTSRPYAKDRFDRRRGERVAWIGLVIAGAVEGTECYLLPPKGGARLPGQRENRVYIVYAEAYVVWLTSRVDGRWRFSTAYVAGYSDMRRYRREGRRLWAHKNTP